MDMRYIHNAFIYTHARRIYILVFIQDIITTARL